MRTPILRQHDVLIASLQAGLTDSDLNDLRDSLVREIGVSRAAGVILEVSALDVVDSFAARTLVTIARAAQLRGARTVIVGIAPEVAFSMVQLGITFADVMTALDLEAGLRQLSAVGNGKLSL